MNPSERILILLFALTWVNLSAVEPTRLSTGWEYYQGSLGSTWEMWRGEAASDNVAWTAVRSTVAPHCAAFE